MKNSDSVSFKDIKSYMDLILSQSKKDLLDNNIGKDAEEFELPENIEGIMFADGNNYLTSDGVEYLLGNLPLDWEKESFIYDKGYYLGFKMALAKIAVYCASQIDSPLD